MIDGNLRSAVHGRDAALLATLEISAEQLEYLTHRGWEWMAPACVWFSEGKERDALWCIDAYKWSVSVGGLVLATHETFDMHACQHEWSTVPARDVLHIWEAWVDEAVQASLFDDAKHRDAPRKAIEAKEAWCRGEIDDEALRLAWMNVQDAKERAKEKKGSWFSLNALCAASYRGGRQYRGSARNSAWFASRTTHFNSFSEGQDFYLELFTAHVLSCLANKKHTKEQ